MRVALPGHLERYVVEKGSITIDGVSLTVAAVGDGWLEVALIPHTLEVTTLGRRIPGHLVNLEVDILAKYVERLLEAVHPVPPAERTGVSSVGEGLTHDPGGRTAARRRRYELRPSRGPDRGDRPRRHGGDGRRCRPGERG